MGGSFTKVLCYTSETDVILVRHMLYVRTQDQPLNHFSMGSIWGGGDSTNFLWLLFSMIFRIKSLFIL